MAIATPARAVPSANRTAANDYAAGDLIASKYKLVSHIALGGMGTVWVARNTTLHSDVAIKLVRREIAGSDEAAQRLLTEARAAAQLEHPSIVKVHDFGETERGDPYIAMELLKGESLDEMADRVGCLPPATVVQILLPILSALMLVHDKGIVHRDIKPDNIILVPDAAGDLVPKLVDFGIARLQYRTVEKDDDEPTTGPETRMTQMGRILGSPEFMSPEQARGDQHIDGRSDLWSLVIVLYHAISGDLPFVAGDVEKQLLAILAAPPVPLSDHGIDDPALWQIIERGLQKRVDHRWQDAHSLGSALAQWLEAQGIHDDVTGRPLHKQWGVARPSTEPRASSHPSLSGISQQPRPSRPSVEPWPTDPSIPPAAPLPRASDPGWVAHEHTTGRPLATSTHPRSGAVHKSILLGGALLVAAAGAAIIFAAAPSKPAPAAPPSLEASPTATAPSETDAPPAPSVDRADEPLAEDAPSASALPSGAPYKPPPRGKLAGGHDDPPAASAPPPAPVPKKRDGSMPLPDDVDF